MTATGRDHAARASWRGAVGARGAAPGQGARTAPAVRARAPAARAGAARPRSAPRAREIATSSAGGARRAGSRSALVDVDDGTLLAAHDAQRLLPPASVAKALTALYALDALGPDHRFATRLLATAPVDGWADRGGPDPRGGRRPGARRPTGWRTSRARWRRRGSRAVGGLPRLGRGAAPGARDLARSSLPWLGYNPADLGAEPQLQPRLLRVGAGRGGDYRVRMEAVGDNHRPPVVASPGCGSRPRRLPVYTYDAGRRRGRLDRGAGAARRRGEPLAAGAAPGALRGQAFVGLANEAGAGAARADACSRRCPRARWRSPRLESEPAARSSCGHAAPLDEPHRRGAGAGGERGAGARPRDAGRVGRGHEPLAAGDDGRAGAARGPFGPGRRKPGRGAGDGAGARLARDDGPAAAAPQEHRADRRLGRGAGPAAGAGAGQDGDAQLRLDAGGLCADAGRGRTWPSPIFSADVEAREASRTADDEIPAGSREFLARSRRLQQELLQRWGLMSV